MEITELLIEPYKTNCYIVSSDEKNAVCIDPGFEPAKIVSRIKELGLSLRYIFLTHGHYDHIGGVKGVKAAFPDAAVVIMKEDEDLCRDPSLMVPDLHEGISVDRMISDGEKISLDELTFEFLLTPGHSKGSCVILCGDKMFSGDTLMSRGCGRTDFYGGSTADMRKSLKRIGELPGDYEVFCGHGPGTTMEIERYANMYLRKAMGLTVL